MLWRLEYSRRRCKRYRKRFVFTDTPLAGESLALLEILELIYWSEAQADRPCDRRAGGGLLRPSLGLAIWHYEVRSGRLLDGEVG